MTNLSKLPTGDSAPAIRLRKAGYCTVCARVTHILVPVAGNALCVQCARDAGITILPEKKR